MLGFAFQRGLLPVSGAALYRALERATYRRTIEVPAEWGDARVFLCFGAVHHRATVSIALPGSAQKASVRVPEDKVT